MSSIIEAVTPLTNIGTDVKKKQTHIHVHNYSLSPGFNFCQLFLTGLGFQYQGNNLLASQSIDHEAKDMKSYSKDDIKKPLDLNSIFDKESPTVCRIDYFNNILKKWSDDSKNININEIIDTLYDRNPDLVQSFKNLIDKSAFLRNIDIKCLDINDNDSYIENVLSNIRNYFNKPILFYSEIGIPKQNSFFVKLPMRVLIKKEYSKNESNNNKYLKKIDQWFQIQFIIGSKKGIPILLLINDAQSISLCDNSSKIAADYGDLDDSIDTIYMVYYSIDEKINSDQSLFKSVVQNRKSGFHAQINHETDDILKNYIMYKFDCKDNPNSWKNREFNFIQFIKESIQYPAFFGLCSGFNIDTCYYGSVMLSYDKISSDKILESISPSSKNTSDLFYKGYNAFTVFAMKLFEFMYALGYGKLAKDEAEAIKQCKSLFSTTPSINDMLFDFFIDFLKNLIDKGNLSDNQKDKFLYYIFLAVENPGIDIQKSREHLNTVFPVENVVEVWTVAEALKRFDLLKIDEQLIGTKLKFDGYEQKYIKIGKFKEHVSMTTPESHIHL